MPALRPEHIGGGQGIAFSGGRVNGGARVAHFVAQIRKRVYAAIRAQGGFASLHAQQHLSGPRKRETLAGIRFFFQHIHFAHAPRMRAVFGRTRGFQFELQRAAGPDHGAYSRKAVPGGNDGLSPGKNQPARHGQGIIIGEKLQNLRALRRDGQSCFALLLHFPGEPPVQIYGARPRGAHEQNWLHIEPPFPRNAMRSESRICKKTQKCGASALAPAPRRGIILRFPLRPVLLRPRFFQWAADRWFHPRRPSRSRRAGGPCPRWHRLRSRRGRCSAAARPAR